MTRCTGCGVDNDPGAVFCVACGHFLEWTDTEPVSYTHLTLPTTPYV